MSSNLTGLWLTLNRFCNFRCPWCYAKSTKYSKSSDMPLELAKQLIKFGADLGVKEVLLIGGEPTYYPYLSDVIECIYERKMKSTLVTNGYRFSDVSFLKKIEQTHLNSIGVSIKGGTEEQYFDTTKVKDSYFKTQEAIKNLSQLKNIIVGYSVVLSKENLENLENIAKLVAMDKANWLLLSFCVPTIDNNYNAVGTHMPTQSEVITTIVDKLPMLDKILNGQFSIEQSFPNCLWPKEVLDNLIKNNKIIGGCHVQSKSGLIFNEKGNLIVCNSLPNFEIGKFGKDFSTVEDFNNFWNSKELDNLYSKFRKFPSKKCDSCNDEYNCAGGCPLQWLAYNAAEVLN